MNVDEINAKRANAKETLSDVEYLLEHGSSRSLINRIYYALFYMVEALLLTKGLSSNKHKGIMSLFHKEFVNRGIIEVRFGQFYTLIFNQRLQGDYTTQFQIESEEIKEWFEQTKEMLIELNRVIDERINTD